MGSSSQIPFEVLDVFKKGSGNWTQYRDLPKIDLHYSDRRSRDVPYGEAMEEVRVLVLKEITEAQQQGKQYVIFAHGWSTSRPGKTTARSQVRKLVRSADATPFILRGECIQHESVFVAAIRPISRQGG